MREAKKHDGPYRVRSVSDAFMEVVGHDGKVVCQRCVRSVAEDIRDNLNVAYQAGRNAGRADLLKQLGAGDWLPAVGDQVQCKDLKWPRNVERVEIGVHDKLGNVWPLSSCRPYVRPLEVGDKVRTQSGITGKLIAIIDGIGVVWDDNDKVSIDRTLDQLTRVE